MGYFFHLTSDGLWYEWIGRASKRDYADLLEEHGEGAWWMMKDDWYGIDVGYAQENRDCIFWKEIMPLNNTPLYLDFLDRDGVRDQVERIQELYSDPPRDLLERAEFPYLSKTTMDRYVADSIEFLLEFYYLISEGGIPDESNSFLDLFPPERFTPYPAPLGE
ncbi:MAG: hypothetical protein ACC633_06260 [Anaerolineales bacterium]